MTLTLTSTERINLVLLSVRVIVTVLFGLHLRSFFTNAAISGTLIT